MYFKIRLTLVISEDLPFPFFFQQKAPLGILLSSHIIFSYVNKRHLIKLCHYFRVLFTISLEVEIITYRFSYFAAINYITNDAAR